MKAFMFKSKISDVICVALLLGLITILGIMVYYYKGRPNNIFNENGELTVDITKFKTKTGSAEVIISESGLSPTTLSINTGWQVTWLNSDVVPHRIAVDPYPSSDQSEGFDTEALETGESFSYTFNKVGTYIYHDIANPLLIRNNYSKN